MWGFFWLLENESKVFVMLHAGITNEAPWTLKKKKSPNHEM